jgi:broad specificity phosphatase PhoE
VELYIIRHGQSANNVLDDAAQASRHYDPPLTPLDHAQAEAVAAWLSDGRNRDRQVNAETGYSEADATPRFGITHLYCSAMVRAMQTAQPIGRALGLKPEIWIDIHEYGGLYLEDAAHDDTASPSRFTGFPGHTRAEIEAHFPGYIIPDAVGERGWWPVERGQESFLTGITRAMAVVMELRRRSKETPDARIALVTHGTFIDSLIKLLIGQVPDRDTYFLHYNTGITQIDLVRQSPNPWEPDRALIRYINRTAHLLNEQIS